MSRASRGTGKQQGRLADMSLPPELRGRRGRGKRAAKRVGGTPAAQLGHTQGSKARRQAREGEQAMERERREQGG